VSFLLCRGSRIVCGESLHTTLLHGETYIIKSLAICSFAEFDDFPARHVNFNVVSIIHAQTPELQPNIGRSSRTLLVVTTSDLEEVTLEFVTERVAGNLITRKTPHQPPILISFTVRSSFVFSFA
jgi:hypothetical protein